MSTRFTLFLIFITLMLGMASCAETPKPVEEPVAAVKPPEPEGPFYELTKDDITSHPEWSSRNIMLMGTKLGDKTIDGVKNFGTQMGETKPLTEDWLMYYQKNAIGVYSFRMTGKIRKIELFQSSADKIADPKLRSLIASGDLKQMRAIFGMEEGMEDKPEEQGMEYVYDARGIRFIKYQTGNVGLRFSEMKK